MGDRSGGREPKGASLKKSKKNPGASAARVKTVPKQVSSGPTYSLPPQTPSSEPYFDAGVALISRQFDRDRERVIVRSKTEGNCCGMLIWFSDIEKQSAIADLSKLFPGNCYFAAGIHPDNIDRTNKKSHDEWLEKTEEICKKSECIAVMSGLNLSKEVGTHFAQETLLKASYNLAKKLLLPLVLHVNNSKSLEKATEILKQEGWSNETNETEEEDFNCRVLLHDAMTCCEGDTTIMQAAIDAGYFTILAATGLTDTNDEIRHKAQDCVRLIPLNKILVCTDSPWKTPQNITDTYLRTLRNEPGNLPFVMQAISESLSNEDMNIFSTIVRENTFQVFGFNDANNSNNSNSNSNNNNNNNGNNNNNVDKDDNNVAVDNVEQANDIDNDFNNKLKITDNSNHHNNSNEKKQSKGNKDNKKDAKSAASNSSNTNNNKNTAYYSCLKCRRQLFLPKDVSTHQFGANKTVFKIGDEGLCATSIFITLESIEELSTRTQLVIHGTNVECIECGLKLGKYSVSETNCACGAIVSGPVLKLLASKIDYFDGKIPDNIQELAIRAQQEIEEMQKQQAYKDQELELERQQMSGKVKKTKKLKSENKGNFSSYRNKSFIPNASRTASSKEKDSNNNNNSKKQGNNLDHLKNLVDDDEEEYDESDNSGDNVHKSSKNKNDDDDDSDN